MSDARVIKTARRDLAAQHSAMMVDAAYDELYRAMKPGMSENQAVGFANKILYDLGSEYVEGVNAISGERCNPHPHVFSDRVLRPGDPGVLRHPAFLHGLSHLLLPVLRIGYAFACAGRRLCALPRLFRCRHLADSSRPHHRAKSHPCGRRRRSSASPMRKPLSRCSSGTASASPSGKSRSSAAWFRSSIPMKSSPAWCSRSKPSGPRKTAGAPRASKKRSSSPKPVTKSSRDSPPKSCWWRARITSRRWTASHHARTRSRAQPAHG